MEMINESIGGGSSSTTVASAADSSLGVFEKKSKQTNEFGESTNNLSPAGPPIGGRYRQLRLPERIT